MMRKRAYFVYDNVENMGIPVVATSSKEARSFGYGHECLCDVDYIDIRVKWSKGVNVDNLPIGEFKDYLEALKRGVLGFVEYVTCPNCKTEDTMVYYDKRFFCSACE